jgi:hypothetical protein
MLNTSKAEPNTSSNSFPPSRAFHTRTTASEEEPEGDYLTEETPQIQRRKMFLRWYLIKLCQDPTSMDFWRYLNKVG